MKSVTSGRLPGSGRSSAISSTRRLKTPGRCNSIEARNGLRRGIIHGLTRSTAGDFVVRIGPRLDRVSPSPDRDVGPAHPHERRPHVDVGDPDVAIAHRVWLHDLSGFSEAV